MKERLTILIGLSCVLVIASVLAVNRAGRTLLALRSPVMVSLTRSNQALRIFPGVTGVFMILPDGSLWRWGQTGGRPFSRARAPEQFGTSVGWVKAIAPNNHCLALRSDGTLWEWG
jgi:hypothetical protein